MGVLETAVLYLLLGAVVAVAMGLRHGVGGAAGWLRIPAWALCWPLFAPLLLGEATRAGDDPATGPRPAGVPDAPPAGPHPRLADAQRQLLAALGRLEGLAEEVLAPEVARVHHLTASLEAMARRFEEMDALLSTPAFDPERIDGAIAELEGRGVAANDARRQSLAARRRNIERLDNLKDATAEAFERALLQMEEMGAQVAVLRFAEPEGDEVVERIRELAARIEGASEGLLGVP